MIYFHDIDPIALSLGPIKVHWYGIMYLLGFTAAWLLGRKRIAAGRLPGVDANGFSDLLFYAMLGVVLGGRIGYMLFYALGDFLHNPLLLFKVWDGGMSFHGGLLGVLGACWWWSRKHKLHFFDTMDFMAPLVPLGLGFGRIGNFIGAELWGKYTDGTWGVVFPSGLPAPLNQLDHATLQAQFATGALNQFARHPSQLYEALLEGLVMFVVLWAVSAKLRHRYLVGGLFALMYGLFRFAVEFVRMPDNGVYVAFDWLTRGQILSLPLIAFGLVLLAMSRRAPVLQPQLPVAAGARHEGLPGPALACARARRREERSHRHRHPQRVWLADAFQPGRRLPAGHHQEAAPALDHPRAAVVPEGRHQHRLPEGQPGADLGRVGRRERRSRPGLRQAVAQLGHRRWP